MENIIITNRNVVNTKSEFTLSHNVIISSDMKNHDDRKLIGERIRERREELGLKQPQLAKYCGWESQSRISHYENGTREPTIGDIKKIAKALNTEAAYLLFGVIPLQKNGLPEYTGAEQILPKHFVPIITWKQAYQWCRSPQDIIVNQHTEFVPIFPGCGPDCFAVKVEGDSMVSPTAYPVSFKEGEVIVLDPNKKPDNGSFVLAILEEPKEAIFKQYVIDAAKEYLKPLNPQYPTLEITENIKVCGVVIGTFRKF